jgi:hypothetical protein
LTHAKHEDGKQRPNNGDDKSGVRADESSANNVDPYRHRAKQEKCTKRSGSFLPGVFIRVDLIHIFNNTANKVIRVTQNVKQIIKPSTDTI